MQPEADDASDDDDPQPGAVAGAPDVYVTDDVDAWADTGWNLA